MPQNVLVSVLGEGEYLPHLVRAILEKEIIPARNLFLSSKNQVACQAAEGYDVRIVRMIFPQSSKARSFW